MVSSCFHRVPVKGRIVAGRSILALAVLAGALMLAPEDPGAQASICQRHHSAAACQVW